MIDDRSLQSLVEFSGGKVLSVYLDTDLSSKSKDAVKLMLRDRVRDLEDASADEIQAIQKYLDFGYDWQSRGLALFVSGEDLWDVIPLPSAVSSQAYYLERPYVRVLTDVMDRFARYDVALVDRETLKLYRIAWGRIEKELETTGDETRHRKQGGWTVGGSQRSATGSRSEENVALHNLKRAAEVLRKHYQSSRVRRIMLGGSSDVIRQLRPMLPRQVQDSIIGEFSVDMEASSNEILSRSLDIAAQVDLSEEQELVSDAITAAAKGALGVTGSSDTLYALHQGRVRVLLVEESYQAAGFSCANCGYVSAVRNEECPFCRHREITETPDVVNLAIHKAIETGAEVNVVRQNERLSEAGGIAGILRY